MAHSADELKLLGRVRGLVGSGEHVPSADVRELLAMIDKMTAIIDSAAKSG